MRVFTPFWRAARARGAPPPPLPAPAAITAAPWPDSAPVRTTIPALGLLPTAPDWSAGLAEAWTPGEAGAAARLGRFLAAEWSGYAEQRNRPDLPSTSRLSPHLRFGEISARQVWHAATTAHHAGAGGASETDLDIFLTEIGWREFSYHLLYHNPALATRNFQARFDDLPWRTSAGDLRAWQKGRTGFPIVDAGMRQLWQTGWMHNRVRMIVASVLAKHLLIDWREGEAWFWDTLVDADAANNAASWQWVAGSGADAAPYFRVFNPVLQGQKFDPEGAYVRRYVPELAGLPAKFIHAPFEAPHPVLARAGIALGRDYPHPIVGLSEGRDRALAAFATMNAAAA
jgi:deoxyribodipyrimidine photo-lyase